MENIENVRLFAKSLDSTVDQLQESLEPILKKSLDELVAQHGNDNHVDRIKIYNNYAYILISTIFSYLKSVGINTDTHPIMKELTRVKTYMKRLKDLEGGIHNQEEKDKKDAERAKEFIQNALGSNINGGGAAVGDGLKVPAISSSNFQGTHTKFTDDKKEEDSAPPKKKFKSKSPGKVTKPKKGKK